MWRTQKFEHSIVVLGSGFAGIECAKRLARRLRKHPSTHVALVDKENYFVFQPLLPEVAASSIDTTHVVNPVRQFAPEVDFDCAEVSRIDLQEKKVYFKNPEGMAMLPMPYTHLVLALGTLPNLGLIPGMAAHGLPMKTVGDAFHLRNHLVMKLEEAANTRDVQLRKELLSVVVVGGGFSGVETCAEVGDMLESARRWYPELDHEKIRVTLVSSTERILPALTEKLSAYALDKMRHHGIEVLLKARVTSVTPRYCRLGDGTEIPTRTIVCTVGDSPHPVIAALGLPKEKGRIAVDEHLRVRGTDNLWAVGDCAWITNGADGQVCPPTAQFATRQGFAVAENIANLLQNKPLEKFSHASQGYLASLGHRNAVAEVFGIPLSGFVAWFVWRTIYLFKLPGLSRKVRVALDWTLDLVFPREIVQLQVARTDRVGRAHYEAGQDIVRQGEAGEAFYSVIDGEVEVLRTEPGATEAHCLARLGPGAYFGEEALLTGKPRSATVRACTVCDVLVLGRTDFQALSQGLAVIKETLQRGRTSIVRKDSPEVRARLAAIRVADRMSKDPATLREDEPIVDVARRFQETRFSGFPIVDDKARLTGLVTRADLYAAFADDVALDMPVSRIARRELVTAFADDDLDGVLDRIGVQHELLMPVVDRNDPRKVVGMLSISDLFQARVEIELALKCPVPA